MKKKSTFIKDWEDTRKMGRLKYALLHGSIFGIIVGTFTIIVSSYTSSNSNWKEDFLINSVIFVLSGVAGYFLLMWPINEYYYKKYIAKFTSPSKKMKKK